MLSKRVKKLIKRAWEIERQGGVGPQKTKIPDYELKKIEKRKKIIREWLNS